MEETRILYLLGRYPQWSETFIRQDLQMLMDLGVPLLPVTLFPGNVDRRPEWPRVTCLSPPERVPHRGQKHRKSMSFFGRLQPRSLRTALSLFHHRQLQAMLRELVKEHGICHVHAEFADLPAVLASSLSHTCQIGYSVGVHARDVNVPKYDPHHLYTDALFITVCNEFARQALLQLCPEAAPRIHLIHHGLDPRGWPFRRETLEFARPLQLLFAGRFVPKKGIETLFQAMARMNGVGTPAALRLLGNGPSENSLRQLARDLDIEEQLTWSGVVSRAEVRTALTHCDALVVPSLEDDQGDQDGIPNVLVEAMAVGTPVVGTTAGSLPEVLNEQTGWVFPPGEDDMLAETLCRLQLMAPAANERRETARRLVEERFDVQTLARQRANLLCEAAGVSEARVQE